MAWLQKKDLSSQYLDISADRFQYEVTSNLNTHSQANFTGVNTMDNFNAIGIAEGFIESDSEEQYLQAWQHLVDTGLAWQLQGWFGRTAMTLINEGLIEQKEEV